MKCTENTPVLEATLWKEAGDHKRVGVPSKNPLQDICNCEVPKEKHGVIGKYPNSTVVCPGSYIIEYPSASVPIYDICPKKDFKKKYTTIKKAVKKTKKK